MCRTKLCGAGAEILMCRRCATSPQSRLRAIGAATSLSRYRTRQHGECGSAGTPVAFGSGVKALAGAKVPAVDTRKASSLPDDDMRGAQRALRVVRHKRIDRAALLGFFSPCARMRGVVYLGERLKIQMRIDLCA